MNPKRCFFIQNADRFTTALKAVIQFSNTHNIMIQIGTASLFILVNYSQLDSTNFSFTRIAPTAPDTAGLAILQTTNAANTTAVTQSTATVTIAATLSMTFNS